MEFSLAFEMIEGRIAVYVVETIARIRRAHFVQGKSIKAIRRELRVSRKTVRKVIRSEAMEFQYEREQQPSVELDGKAQLGPAAFIKRRDDENILD